MGKIILCVGEHAKNPYIFNSSQVRIYTMEQLCYFVYNNIEVIGEELFKEEVAAFIRDELKMPERAEFIDSLRKNHAGLKDIIVSILCSTDYYTEKEIKDLISQIDMLYKLKPIQRKKRNADILMNNNKYMEAAKEYRQILNAGDITDLTSEECGDVMHNAAVINALSGAFITAAEGFLNAYERNHRKESLKQYLFCLKLSKQYALYEREINNYVRIRSFIQEIEEEFASYEETFKNTEEYAQYMNILRLKEQGRISEYNKKIDEVLEGLKTGYRNDHV